jgi:hypothetical protein
VTRVVLVPGVLALLPEYAGVDDPVADLRVACHEAVGWLGRDVTILADSQGRRVADHLLSTTDRAGDHPSYLVVGNGSACRSEKAPGYLDPRAVPFDDDLRTALTSSDVKRLDFGLGESLLASLDGIRRLPEVLEPGARVQVDYDDDPYGVQYWVIRWES